MDDEKLYLHWTCPHDGGGERRDRATEHRSCVP
jgi:hypothetical protein